jgi:hypothetical protein
MSLVDRDVLTKRRLNGFSYCFSDFSLKDIVSVVHLKKTDECYLFSSVQYLLTHMLAYLFLLSMILKKTWSPLNRNLFLSIVCLLPPSLHSFKSFSTSSSHDSLGLTTLLLPSG